MAEPTKTMLDLALAVIRGDAEAALGLADQVHEQWEGEGVRLPPVQRLSVDAGRLRVVIHFPRGTTMDEPAWRLAVEGWLRGDGPLFLIGATGFDLYEIPAANATTLPMREWIGAGGNGGGGAAGATGGAGGGGAETQARGYINFPNRRTGEPRRLQAGPEVVVSEPWPGHFQAPNARQDGPGGDVEMTPETHARIQREIEQAAQRLRHAEVVAGDIVRMRAALARGDRAAAGRAITLPLGVPLPFRHGTLTLRDADRDVAVVVWEDEGGTRRLLRLNPADSWAAGGFVFPGGGQIQFVPGRCVNDGPTVEYVPAEGE